MFGLLQTCLLCGAYDQVGDVITKVIPKEETS